MKDRARTVQIHHQRREEGETFARIPETEREMRSSELNGLHDESGKVQRQ